MAFTAEVPMEMPGPVDYIVYRQTTPGQPIDHAAPPVFFPPKDSDELFDALRAKYPHVKTHSERMRDAIIEFLLEERQAEQVQSTSPSMREMSETISASPWQLQSWPSMTSCGTTSTGTDSTFSSPDMLGLATPSFETPLPQHAKLSRHQSMAASATVSSPGATENSVELSPPALEQMVGVFSVSSANQPKQRIRRKMTESEKSEYRKRRMVKACEKCQKRKRKCDHNQGEMETLTAKSKVKKPHQSGSHKKPTTPPTPIAPTKSEQDTFVDFEAFGFDDLPGKDMQLFDDIDWDNFLQAPVAISQHGFDRSKHLDDDFVLDGPTNTTRHLSKHVQNDPILQDQLPMVGGVQQTTQPDQQLRWDSLHEDQSPLSEDQDALKQDRLHSFQRTTGGSSLQCSTSMNEANPHEALKSDQIYNAGGLLAPSSRSSSSGNRMLWEHLRTGQVSPTHNLHIREAQQQSSYVLDCADSSCQSTGHQGLKSPQLVGLTSQKLPSTSVVSSSRTLHPRNDSASVVEGRRPPPLGGEDIDRAPSPSAELYALRRRLSRNLNRVSGVNYNVNQEPRSRMNADPNVKRSLTGDGLPLALRASPQANGGAYLRPEDGTLTRQPPTATSSVSPSVLASSATCTYDQHTTTIAAQSGNEETGLATQTGLTTTPRKILNHFVDKTISQEDRLPDHVRRRDHFGRLSPAITAGLTEHRAWRDLASVLAVLAGLLMLAALLPKDTSSFALLSFALAVTPAPHESKERQYSFAAASSYLWSSLQCTWKNSSWLTLLQQRIKQGLATTSSAPGACHTPATSGCNKTKRANKACSSVCA